MIHPKVNYLLGNGKHQGILLPITVLLKYYWLKGVTRFLLADTAIDWDWYQKLSWSILATILRKQPTLVSFTFLPEVHKNLCNVPGSPVVSNCGTPTEGLPEYLGFVRKPVMEDGWSYLRDTEDLFKISNV